MIIFYWSILEGLWNFEIWRIKFSFRQNVVLQYWHSILEDWSCFSLKCLLAVRLCWNVLVHSRHLNNPFFIWTHPIPSDNWSKVASISPTNRWSQLIFSIRIQVRIIEELRIEWICQLSGSRFDNSRPISNKFRQVWTSLDQLV